MSFRGTFGAGPSGTKMLALQQVQLAEGRAIPRAAQVRLSFRPAAPPGTGSLGPGSATDDRDRVSGSTCEAEQRPRRSHVTQVEKF